MILGHKRPRITPRNFLLHLSATLTAGKEAAPRRRDERRAQAARGAERTHRRRLPLAAGAASGSAGLAAPTLSNAIAATSLALTSTTISPASMASTTGTGTTTTGHRALSPQSRLVADAAPHSGARDGLRTRVRRGPLEEWRRQCRMPVWLERREQRPSDRCAECAGGGGGDVRHTQLFGPPGRRWLLLEPRPRKASAEAGPRRAHRSRHARLTPVIPRPPRPAPRRLAPPRVAPPRPAPSRHGNSAVAPGRPSHTSAWTSSRR